MNSHLQRLQEAITLASSGMIPSDLERHRVNGKWSGAEILEHLNLTYTATVKNFERSLKAEKALELTPALKQRLRTFLVVDLGYFPRGREAPKGTVPVSKPAEQVLSEITENIATMDRVLCECELRFGKRSFVANHPVLGPLTVNQWRKFHWVHGRHHVKQILSMR